MITLAVFAALLFLVGIVSARMEKFAVTAPMVFTAGGSLYMWLLPGGIPGGHAVQILGEIALVLLLFSDAARIRIRDLWVAPRLSIRLLGIAMPLTIIAGTLAAHLLFEDLTLWEAAILATLLAPTDAGLGHAIVNSEQVPAPIRQSLNIEAGLNDGLSIPFLMLFIALAMGSVSEHQHSWTVFASRQIGLGIVVGLATGLIGGWLANQAFRHHDVESSFDSLVLLPLALIAFVVAGGVGGNGFIAAYVAGLSIRVTFAHVVNKVEPFVEAEGQLLNYAVFFILGMKAVSVLPDIGLFHVLFAILSLTLVRMLPVGLALIGTRLQPASVLFLGWFGPRGLASIVLGLIFLEHAVTTPGVHTIITALITTVLLSVFAHGITASPAIRFYSQRIGNMAEDTPERH